MLVGRSIGRRYDVLELLGVGGMGAVYRVLDRELDEVVALKVILDELAVDPETLQRFRTEVRLARRVTHHHIARTFELGQSDGLVFCTMELVDGESLRARLQRDDRLPIAEAAAIAAAVCEGLAAAHAAGVIHRDVKPDNVLVDRRGRVVLTDFGVAQVVLGDGGVAGTPEYMAPEQLRGVAPTPAADVYSVGVLLHEAVTGKRAFDGTLLQIYEAKEAAESLVTPDVPPKFADVIAKATARDVTRRFESALALREALASWTPRGTSIEIGHARVSTSDHLRTVAVRPPVASRETTYLALGIYDELLHRLARVPRLHMQGWPATGPADATVELFATGDLEIVVSGLREPLRLRAPLTIGHVSFAAQLAFEAVTTVLAGDDPMTEKRGLVLRAKEIAQSGVARAAGTVGLLEQAAELAPRDAQVAANLAIAKVQGAFWATLEEPGLLDEASRLVDAALVTAPDDHETQLAAGHLALHRGESTVAARRFRLAIARAPHDASAHEQLGRMLLEAGHLGPGLDRLNEAIALSPYRRSARWEIARVYALEQRWTELDRCVAELAASGQDNLLGELRFTCWRGDDVERVRQLRARFAANPMWDPPLFESMFAVLCDGAWEAERARVLDLVLHSQRRSHRRRAVVAQFAAETAAIAGDVAATEELIAYAIAHGLFDLHWLWRCPVLDAFRARPRFPALRADVARRADAILDALYGDATSDTVRIG